MNDPFQVAKEKVLVPVVLTDSGDECKVHLNLIWVSTCTANLWWPVPKMGWN